MVIVGLKACDLAEFSSKFKPKSKLRLFQYMYTFPLNKYALQYVDISWTVMTVQVHIAAYTAIQ